MPKGPEKRFVKKDGSASVSPERNSGAAPSGKHHSTAGGRKGGKKSAASVSPTAIKIAKILGLLVLPVVFAAFGYQIHQNYVVLPALVNTPCPLPKILGDDHFNATNNPDRYWGTYRGNLYFGMRTRSPRSPLVGLMWYEQPSRFQPHEPKIRHWCDQNDGLLRYGWMEHDGKSFGRQEILERNLLLETSFVKRLRGDRGGDWTARVEAKPANAAPSGATEAPPTPAFSFVLYLGLGAPDNDGSYLRPHLKGQKYLEYIDRIDGYTPELGSFKLKIVGAKQVLMRSFLAARMEPYPDVAHAKEIVMRGTGMLKSKELESSLGLMGYVPGDQPPTPKPNILAVQLTVAGGTAFDIVYESVVPGEKPTELSGAVYDKALKEKQEEFREKFESLFGLEKKQYAEDYKALGSYALSNMLGSIGFYHGYSRVISKHNSVPVRYGPLSLFTAMPSRPFFPRGFLWDEGFHHLLLRKWDPELSLDILGSWLDLMTVEGWLPREMILGAEAEAKVPAQFIVQDSAVANPPMFFYLLGQYLRDGGGQLAERHRDYFEKAYPRLKLWYNWLNSSQSGLRPGTYRWRGRNGTTDAELNPKTLPSGLDDYPRASHPSQREYHLDLYCWMAVSSRTMENLAKFVGDSGGRYGETAELLWNTAHLDEAHWSEKFGRYCDFGLHTRNVKMEKPKPQLDPEGRPRPNARTEMIRVVLKEPQLRLVSDTFGYVSLYPLFLRLLPAGSPKLEKLLTQLKDPELLWSKYGLRSLSKSSPLYRAWNTEHDPPYWRGPVWMNMNYLALAALHHYSQIKGPYRQLAFETYANLRSTIVQNVAKEFKRTGYLWENYDDETGEGKGSHPFTGWTSLVLLMMGEQFD